MLSNGLKNGGGFFAFPLEKICYQRRDIELETDVKNHWDGWRKCSTSVSDFAATPLDMFLYYVFGYLFRTLPLTLLKNTFL